MAASCRPPRKTKSSPVFPVVGQLLQRHARHLTSNAAPAGGQRLAVRIVERELELGEGARHEAAPPRRVDRSQRLSLVMN